MLFISSSCISCWFFFTFGFYWTDLKMYNEKFKWNYELVSTTICPVCVCLPWTRSRTGSCLFMPIAQLHFTRLCLDFDMSPIEILGKRTAKQNTKRRETERMIENRIWLNWSRPAAHETVWNVNMVESLEETNSKELNLNVFDSTINRFRSLCGLCSGLGVFCIFLLIRSANLSLNC